MDDASAWATIATERRALADLLESLTVEQWATPSLCRDWTVRHVAAHLMVGPTGSTAGFLRAMVRARGSFARANHALADDRARLPTATLVADLRERAGSRFTPPGMDWHAPLTDLLVHRLDITVPLGLDHGRTLDPWADALDLLVGRRAVPGFLPRGLPGLTYAATDVEWMRGSGPRVEAPVEALALAITRRPARLSELAGPGAAALRTWARG
ncbi:maleylpyruvate isomerase family mycothiol-dependent enzyme [Trujillonella endophytica]|uniref:TIGR03083 family protein n=1 Tax=Trujillonella endophytica TaxID=673521 RepID=A0A1H8U3K6_9ACTN|nr:maleylpyruvate isomerase family mycothiol-dependent enzyme [Trujillella endophytica]SEO97741.1 TIGR03083 family protein [Trujillella endophytica]